MQMALETPYLVASGACLADAEDHVDLQAGGIAAERHAGLLLQSLHALQSQNTSVRTGVSARTKKVRYRCVKVTTSPPK